MITIQQYSSIYDADLRELSKLSQKGDITFSFYREPSFIAGALIQTKTPDLYIILKDKKLIGCFNMGSRPLWYHGKVENMRYLCDVKMHPDFQNGSAFIRLISKTYEIMSTEKFPTSIVMFSDNHRILNIVKGRKNKRSSLKIFHDHPIGLVKTTLIDRKNTIKSTGKKKITKAKKGDKELLQAFINEESSKIDFYPVYNLDELGSDYNKDLKIEDFYIIWDDNRIVGTLAIWDLRKVKQTVVEGYSQKFRLVKPFYNMYSKISGKAPMVDIGSEFKNKFISCLLIEERDVDIYRELLGFVLNDMKNQDYHYLLSTLDVRDPLSNVHEEVRNKRVLTGEFHLGDLDKDGEGYCSGAYFYVEAARV